MQSFPTVAAELTESKEKSKLTRHGACNIRHGTRRGFKFSKFRITVCGKAETLVSEFFYWDFLSPETLYAFLFQVSFVVIIVNRKWFVLFSKT